MLSYGCQVWGPEIFAGKLRNPLNLPSEKVHTNYLRIMAGVGNGADKVMLMREFGRYPVMWHWVALATRFWIRAIKMGSHKLVCKALRADIELMLAGCKKCWSYYLLQSLTIVGVVQDSDWSPSGTSHVTVDSIMALDIQEKVVRESLKQMFDKCWEDVDLVCEHPQDPACPRNRIIHNSYVAWARGLHDDAPTYLKAKTLSFRMVQCIAKMRLGWHCLAIHTGRYNGIQGMTGCVGCVKSLVIGMILHGQFQLKILSTSCWIVECFTLSGTISPSSSSPPPYQGNPRIVMLRLFSIIVIMCKL